MYSRKPVKNAPAPNAITVRSRKIHRPKAKRLSMLVWFRPFTRHRPAEYRPNSSRPTQGKIQSRNLPVPQRLTPRAINSLSTGGLLGSGAWRAGDLPHPLPLRAVIDLGLGADLLEQPETLRPFGVLGRLAGSIVQVAELNG